MEKNFPCHNTIRPVACPLCVPRIEQENHVMEVYENKHLSMRAPHITLTRGSQRSLRERRGETDGQAER